MMRFFTVSRMWSLGAALAVLAALVTVLRADEPAAPKPPIERVNRLDDADMVWIPAGEFLMGSTDAAVAALSEQAPTGKTWWAAEQPQRTVYLDGYWIYKYEVTVAQYKLFCYSTNRKMPTQPRWADANHPVVCVNWQDATDYAKWVGGHLPTEAQWEKAARGTDGRQYPWGNEWDATKCITSVGAPRTGHSRIGSCRAGASPYGVLDMSGSVWEWCQDWFDKDYYAQAPARNPQGPTTGVYRVLRGGSWHTVLKEGPRCASRDSGNPARRGNGDGFRVVVEGNAPE